MTELAPRRHVGGELYVKRVCFLRLCASCHRDAANLCSKSMRLLGGVVQKMYQIRRLAWSRGDSQDSLGDH